MSNDIRIEGGIVSGNVAIGDGAKAISVQFANGGVGTGSENLLLDGLRKYNVSDGDLQDLLYAIKQDEGSPALSRKEFGPNVRSWMQIMFGKAVNSIWQVELGMAGSILASAMQHYYGWG
ncbi:hypothetical protein K5M33_16625 [Chromobacterium vaccinii]|nr:hypothetical protein [Chromobacterium vaccinii]MBX9358347.1 hypothetical protein [Chromobacterium vaccinii]